MTHCIVLSTLFITRIGLLNAVQSAGASEQQPNIILLMGDDHGWDETGYNGHPYLKTPVLDEIAKSGLQFDRFYSAGTNCSPTRATIITGRHHNRTGTFSPGWSLRPEEIGIAEILRKAGYATGHFGKWHLGPVKAASPTNPGAMGFETWLSHDNFFELDPVLSRDGAPPEKIKGESSEIIIAEAIRLIERSKQANKPFFIVVWFGSPHEPYSGLEKDLALYDQLPADFGNRQVQLTSNETGLQTNRLQRDVLRERFAEITAMDRSIGQLREHLNKTGLREETLLWYCGDNGTPPEAVATVPFRGQKGSIYDGGLRVPGLIEWPARITEARKSDIAATTSDIFATLCELASQPLPKRPLDGISLVPLLDGTMMERPSPVMFWIEMAPRYTAKTPYIDPALQIGTTPTAKRGPEGFTRNFQNYKHAEIREQDFRGPRAILSRNFKLVLNDRGKRGIARELFDVYADPAETENLITSHTAEAAELERQLRAWQESVLHSLTGADYPTSSAP